VWEKALGGVTPPLATKVKIWLASLQRAIVTHDLLSAVESDIILSSSRIGCAKQANPFSRRRGRVVPKSPKIAKPAHPI